MQQNQNQQREFRVRINHHIRAYEVRVIAADGSNLGVMATRDALKLAKDQNLDLVEINGKSSPPIVKLMDYGRYKYDEKKKAQSSKKNQQVQELKEITFRPNTDENDLRHKLTQVKGFLSEGHRVKFTIRFRGREVTHADIGQDKLKWILQELEGQILPNPQVNMEGKFMSMVVAPVKK